MEWLSNWNYEMKIKKKNHDFRDRMHYEGEMREIGSLDILICQFCLKWVISLTNHIKCYNDGLGTEAMMVNKLVGSV